MARFAHMGICVSDLKRATRFYCNALGFRAVDGYDVGDEFGRLMELDGVKLRSQFLQSEEGLRLELLCFASPPSEGSRQRRPLNRYGLTHLCFQVRDVDTTARRIRDFGGVVHEPTRTTIGQGGETRDFVYCSDPDGTRIELMKL